MNDILKSYTLSKLFGLKITTIIHFAFQFYSALAYTPNPHAARKQQYLGTYIKYPYTIHILENRIKNRAYGTPT